MADEKRPGMEPDPDKTLVDHGADAEGDDGGGEQPSKIADALPMIEEMARNGTLASRIVILPHSEHLSLDVEEHPELADEKLDAPVVLIVGARVDRVPEKKKDSGDGPEVAVPLDGPGSVGLFVSEVAVVHGKKPGKKFQEEVSSNIARMMREKHAGTGPHSGRGGPLVKSDKQVQAIAYSKAERGE